MSTEFHDCRPAAGLTRRSLIKTSIAGSLASPLVLGGLAAEAPAATDHLGVAPVYFPTDPSTFTPIDLTNKLAVVTGASRGNGRAIGEALTKRGVSVIGTSRNPARVPNPPAFPLLSLDVSDPASVGTFPARLAATAAFRRRGAVDILANNAGRFVFGEIIPLSQANLAFYTSQRDLAVRTLYSGHVLMTNVILPLMPKSGYARIIFTVSIAAYYTGANFPGASGIDTYAASKTALRVYADNLRATLTPPNSPPNSNVLVSTVNPYVMHTALAQHPNPIYTQPVNAIGESDTDQNFNNAVRGVRTLLAGGQDPVNVGETYGQLAQMPTPTANVAVASPLDPRKTQGFNVGIEAQPSLDNPMSAIPLDSP
jgi:NAD(P)-dependent dehydrogenase (short-subunit alcohol dehydrogenase family)